MFGDICYRYRKQRKESFLRDPVLCVALLCFCFDSIQDDFSLFNRVGKAWTPATKQRKIMKITNVFCELIELIELIYEETKEEGTDL